MTVATVADLLPALLDVIETQPGVGIALLVQALLVLAGIVSAFRTRGSADRAQTAAPTAAAEPGLRAEPIVEVAAEPEPVPAPVSRPEPGLEPEPEPEAPAPEPVAPVPEPEPALELPAPRPLRERLLRTSDALVGRLGKLLGGRKVDADLLDELESVLFTADLGVQTADDLLGVVKREVSGQEADAVRGVLREEIRTRLARVQPDAPAAGFAGPVEDAPHVVLVLGVNGSGKTTTIGKLAARYRAAGRSVVLGAGDTFRAAAMEQLQVWGERVGCPVVVGPAESDPAAVAFDTVKHAVAEGAEVAIIDTAGRLQTKAPLMEELGKIVRVLGRDCPGAPHEVLLVLDANTGQNALSQAELFTEVAGVTGIVLTKLDGTAKGGVIVGLADRFSIPVRYVGVGEGIEDLRDFDAGEFVEALFAEAT